MTQSEAKILVIGNCQARPVARLLAQTGRFTMLEPIILHLSKEADAEAHTALMAEADIVFAQRTADTFNPAHLRSSALRQTFEDRLRIWPNIFYSGQQPYLRYMTHSQKGRLLGPLEAVHDLRILRRWLHAQGETAWGNELDAPGYANQIAERSFRELEQRENGCDVKVSDIIANAPDGRRLFFTFNHPSAYLLARLTERLLQTIARPVTIDEAPFGEPLSRYIAPSTWTAAPAWSGRFKGNEIALEADGKIALGGIKEYDAQELEAAFFACYTHAFTQNDISEIRFTPHI